MNGARGKPAVDSYGPTGAASSTRRNNAYLVIISGLAGKQVHVVALDHRGFGRSSGHPTEAELKEDALSVVGWTKTVRGVPIDRTVVLAQGLGNAVASAALNAIVNINPRTRFAGIILCATFTNAFSMLTSYQGGGCVSVLAPLKAMPLV